MRDYETVLKEEHPLLWIAMYHHKTHKAQPISFEDHRFMRKIYMDTSDYMVVQKGVQCGLSEYLVVRALYSLMKGRSIFYVMPTDSMRTLFVSDRFNRSLEYAPFYRQNLSDGSKTDSDNMGLKHFGKGSINFVGSLTSRPFFSYPADELIIDELDKCDQSNIAIADERLSASTCKTIIKVSNPTTQNFGINYEFNLTDKKRWYIKCDHCGEWINPDFFKHVVKEVDQGVFVLRDNNATDGGEIQAICTCGKPLNRFGKGQWIPERQRVIRSGYIISKLFSTSTSIREMVNKFEEGQKNDTIMQRFYNGDLGLPFTSTGSQISFDALNACKRNYTLKRSSDRPCVMGVDVGSVLHTVIGEIQEDGTTRLVFIGTVDGLADILELVKRYNVKIGCIDALPETRMSKELCYKVRGMFMVYFGQVKKDAVNIQTKTVTVNRTESLDALKEAINLEFILLPENADKIAPIGENGMSQFYNQINAPTRLFDEKRNVYIWDEGGNADHYCFSLLYLTIAKRMLAKVMK